MSTFAFMCTNGGCEGIEFLMYVVIPFSVLAIAIALVFVIKHLFGRKPSNKK